MSAAQQALEAGVAALGLPADPLRLEQLADYTAELLRWNKQTNLTAITDPLEIAHKHLLDSLAALPLELDGRVCDVGSGAGLPGLLWAGERPELELHSVDARQRKVAFQAHMGRRWGLPHFVAHHQRVEDLQGPFELVVFRAFAPLPRALPQLQHLLSDQGRMLALKGPGVESELAELDPASWRYTMTPISVPGLTAQRFVVELQQADAPVVPALSYRTSR